MPIMIINGTTISVQADGVQSTGMPAGGEVQASVIDVTTRATVTTQPDYSTVLTIDPHPSSVTWDVYPYSLVTPTERASKVRNVVLKGGSSDAAHNGMMVEGQEIYSDNTAGPWVDLGVISAGRFSGTIACPAMDAPITAKFRVRLKTDHSVMAILNNPHTVGFAYVFTSRSTFAMVISHLLRLNTNLLGVVEPFTATSERPVLAIPGQVSALTAGYNSNGGGGNTNTQIKYGLVKSGFVDLDPLTQDSFKTFANQWAKFSRKHVLIIDLSRNTNQVFPPFSAFAEIYGQQGCSGVIGSRQGGHDDDSEPGSRKSRADYPVTAALPIWAANTEADFIERERLCARESFYGRPDMDIPVVCMSTTRNSGTNGADTLGAKATQQLAGINPILVPDMRSQNNYPSHAHCLVNDKWGAQRIVSVFGQVAARLAGYDTSQQPYFGRVMFSADRTKFYTRAIAVNGGVISAIQPNDIRGFQLREPGGSWVPYGHTAVLNGDLVTGTKLSGAWPVGTEILWDVNTPPAGSGAAEETALIKGFIYESLDAEIHNRGLVVGGGMVSGVWTPRLSHVVDAYDAAFFGPQTFSVTSAAGGVTISGRMPAGATLTMSANPEPQPIITVPAGGRVYVLDKTPAQTVDAEGRVLHGAMANPTPATNADASSLQALDGRAGAGAQLTANDTYSAARAAKYPLSLKPNDIYLAAASATDIDRNRKGLLADNLSLIVREGAALPANTMAPKITRSSPSILTMTGPFDINAIEASLTRYSSTGTNPPADFEPYLTRIERFDPGPAIDRSAATETKPGYEGLSRSRIGSPGSDDGNANYGQSRASVMAGVLPLLYLDVGTQAQRRRAVKALLSMGSQLDGIPFGSDGGHHQWSFPAVSFYRKFTGQAPVPLTDRVASNHGAFYLETADTIAELMTPHSDETKFQTSYLRTITAVGTNTVTIAWGSAKWNFVGLELVNVAGSKVGTITAPTSISPPNGNTSLTFTLSAPHAFTVGEQIWIRPPWTVQVGDPQWHLDWNRGPTPGVGNPANGFRKNNNPAVGAAYRKISRPGDFVPFAEALRIWDASYEPLWRYVQRVVAGNYPMAGSQYPHPFMSEDLTLGGGGLQDATTAWGLRIYQQRWSAITYAKP